MKFILVQAHRSFSTTTRLFQDVQFRVNGVLMTVAMVNSVRPKDRTVEHWKVLVDWDLQRSRPYVVVDPLDVSSLLYLSYAGYLSVMKVALSNQQPLLVVANPKTRAPDPFHSDTSTPAPTQNSPYMVELERRWSKSARLTWKQFLNLQTQVRDNVTLAKGTKMVSVAPDTVARTVLLWWRELLHYSEVKHPGSYLRYMIPTIGHLKTLLRNNGQAATISYLKVSLFAVYSYAFGNPLRSTLHLGVGVRLAKGLPRFLDPHLRDGIRQQHERSVRLVASLLNIYRALYAKHGSWDVSTIVKKAPDLSEVPLFNDFKKFCQEVFPVWVSRKTKGGTLPPFFYSTNRMLIRSAGANISGPAIGSIILDAKAWCNTEGQTNHVCNWFDFHKDTTMSKLVRALAGEDHWGDWSLMLSATRSPVKVPGGVDKDGDAIPKIILGRLHAIDEPAGKVRIVAIADYFTQVALKSVHEHLFKILKILSTNDGTFDQDGVTNVYFQRGLRPHWSYDLKAATDSIPLALYKEVLPPFLTTLGESGEHAKERIDLWAKLLVDRDWMLPNGTDFVKYGTGQPMGALSSWASMALVHHALVQFAAYRIGLTKAWYRDYLVLGDDVDIATNSAVADSYRELCSAFSITIGIAKSLTSESNSFEFANRRFAPYGDISPLSLKEELSASTWTARGEYAKRILARFGTSLKDQGTALLRKATTATQWYRLIPELSGLRVSVFGRLVRYCLLCPFSIMDAKEIRVSHIMEWLALLFPSGAAKPFLRENGPNNRLTMQLALRLIQSVRDSTNQVEKAIPQWGMFSFDPNRETDRELKRSKDPFREGRIAALNKIPFGPPSRDTVFYGWDKDPIGYCIPDPRTKRGWRGALKVQGQHNVPLSCPNAFQFLLLAIGSYNEKIDIRVDRLNKQMLAQKGYVQFLRTGSLDMWFEQEPNLIGWLLNQWMELRSVPKVVVPNLYYGSKTIFGYSEACSHQTVKKGLRVTDDNLRQRIFGPLKEVVEVVARETGLFAPPLPYFNDNQRGKSWAQTVRRALNWYKLYTVKLAEVQVGVDLHDRVFSSSSPSITWLDSVAEGSVGTPGEPTV